MTRGRVALWSLIAGLLIAPLIAMRFIHEVAWTTFDFAVAGTLLAVGGAAIELAMRRLRTPRSRWAASALVVLAVAVAWAQGAVGIV
ncbi:hypothetical protein [Phenylobacterium immobile]|uniref:hypothetical protein n=1 Tax=Phenylobacterium immobile TaxID=21 RepID=UPI001C401081|nr:hypothetical protein [Phenylobacterium immobile]